MLSKLSQNKQTNKVKQKPKTKTKKLNWAHGGND